MVALKPFVRLSRSLLAGAALTLGIPGVAAAAGHHRRASEALPTVSEVSAFGAAAPGARVPLKVTLTGRSARTRLEIRLSTHPRPGGRSSAALGSVSVPRVASPRPRQVSWTIRVPRRTRVGRWYLSACAGSGRHLRCASTVMPVLAAPTPRVVAPQTDAAHATSQIVSAATGGAVTATGSDGSTYTLTVPADALASDETITLTPVTSLGGLPAGRFAAGVQISPDGLALLRPATLTINPATPVPVARQTAYFWHGDGQESGVYAPLRDPAHLTLSLEHFSGYSIIDTTGPERLRLANQPTNVQDRMFALAEAIAVERASPGPQANANFWSAMGDYISTRYWSDVRPTLERALTDDSLTADAIQLAMAWNNDATAAGGEDDLAAERAWIQETLSKIYRHAFAQSIAHCSESVAWVQRALFYSHLVQALGANDAQAFADYTAAQRCLRFTLDLVTATTEQAGWTFASTVVVKGLAIPAIGPTPATLVNPAVPVTTTPQWTQMTGSPGGGCTWAFTDQIETQPFIVFSLVLDSTLRERIGVGGHATFETPPPSVTLDMSPGDYNEMGSVTCPDGKGTRTTPAFQKTFTGGWIVTHQSEVTDAGHYILRDWAPGGSGILATKSYDVTLPGGDGTSIRQQSTLTLRFAAPGGQS